MIAVALASMFLRGTLAGIGSLDAGLVARKNMLIELIHPIGHVAIAASAEHGVNSIPVAEGRKGGADVATTKIPS
jgi:hypothetical protein